MAANASKGGRAAVSSRSDLVTKIADQCGLTQSKAEEVTRAYEDTIKETLASGGEVRLTGFGTFKTSRRAARTARNPQTGGTVPVAARTVPRFSPGKQFKDEIGGASGGGASKGGSKGGASKGGSKGGAAKAGAAKGGAAKAGASKGGATKGGSQSGASKGGSKGGASGGGASKGGSKGGRK